MKKKNYRNLRYCKHRGATSLMAMLFVALFGVISISHFYLSNLNVQMARNCRDTSAALSAAESGLEYVDNLINYYVTEYGLKTFEQEVNQEDAAEVFADFHDFLQAELNGSPILEEGGYIGSPVDFSEGAQSGLEVVIPNLIYAPDVRARFSLTIRQYADDPFSLEVISTGSMTGISRRVCIRYSLVKDKQFLEFAVASKSPINITDNSTIGTGIYTDWQNPEIAAPITLAGVSTIGGDINTMLSPEDFDGLGYTLEDVIQGQYDQLNYDQPEVDLPTAEDFDTSMYADLTSNLKSGGDTYKQKEYYPHASGSYTTSVPGSVELNRTVYEDMVITNKQLNSGNALFKNCVFEGILFIGTKKGIGTNNVRFENCTFNGPIVTGVPPKFGPEDWKKNALYFTGGCVFNNTAMEETTILAPNFNVDIGNGTGDSTLTGLVLGGVVDVRGDANINGTIVSMANPLELGDYASQLDTTIGISDQGTHTISITPSPQRLLPMGINTKVLMVRDGNSFFELAN